ncbi:hydrogen gas-evolving membrane-bound hydrogenase subunit E [Wenzhouxiangella sp. XN24]|uniref:hydrogen gas-evolving membrane-bound hydrogenase subunit E n=1 Tax=Wenzhouxiangella sp. XN24 TaxID=2713569 RepID=UPI0013EB9661|nr:hydrogen gas-evolving membrane-bound hydrogenase subunit E [Wenzhouxiangella sp. XN24]NGX15116.1 sodium:proton antiporter [Wenzhouxiangella sp. XN24]
MNRVLIVIVLLAAAVPMLAGVAGLPRPGDPTAPVHTHVASHYVKEGAEASGAANLVTGVLLNYRAFDTFGEVMVIFAALAALTGVSSLPPGQRLRESGGRNDSPGPAGRPISPVVAFIIRCTAPFIALFGAFVIFKGHVHPGGGFQGGVILGALLMMLSVVFGRGPRDPLLPPAVAVWLQAAAPLTFAAVAGLGVFLTGFLLGFPGTALGPVRTLMMIALELGIAIGSAVIILGLFQHMRGD